MKVLGYIFLALILIGVGYACCHFGWLNGLFIKVANCLSVN